MAQIFKPQRKPKAQVAKQARVRIDELDQLSFSWEMRAVARPSDD